MRHRTANQSRSAVPVLPSEVAHKKQQPQRDQDHVAGGKYDQSVKNVVVSKVNCRVDESKGDVEPRQHKDNDVDLSRGKVHKASNVEEQWHLEQIHIVAVRYGNLPGDDT